MRSGLDDIGVHAGRPGQPQRNEGEGGVRHQPVPAAHAERAVRKREPEVADDRHDAGPRRHQRPEAARDAPGAERDAPQEQDPLQGPHGTEEHGPREAHQSEGRRGGGGGAHPGRLPAREEVVPARRPRRERGELPHQWQRPEEEIPRPHGDDEECDDQRHRALAAGGQRRCADPPAETVPSGAATQVVEVVEVRILAEGRAHAPRENGHPGGPSVLLLGALPCGDGVGGIEALVGEAAEVAREPGTSPHLEPAHLGIGEEPVLRQLAPQHRQLGQPPEVPAPGPADGPGPVAIAGEPGDEELTDGQQRRLGQHPQQTEPRVALEHGPQLVAPLQRLHGHGVATRGLPHHQQRLQPAGDRLAVTYPRVRSHHDARPRDLAAPREVEVLAHGDDPGVEALELGEEIGPDQNAATRCHEDIAYGVVLPVVDLSFGDAIHHSTRLVGAHADMEEDARVVPVHELRRHHPGVGTERLLHQLVDGIGIEGDVVVQEQEEGCSLHHAEGLVGRGGVAGVPRQVAHERIGEDPGHPLRHLGIVLPGRQDEDRHLLVVLGRQRRKCLFEPVSGAGRDDDGDHGRHLGVHQGAEAIRSGIYPFRHEKHPQCLLLFNRRDTLVHERSGLPAAPASRTSE